MIPGLSFWDEGGRKRHYDGGPASFLPNLVHIRIFRVGTGWTKGVLYRNIVIILSCLETEHLYYKPLSKSPNKSLTNEVWVKKH